MARILVAERDRLDENIDRLVRSRSQVECYLDRVAPELMSPEFRALRAVPGQAYLDLHPGDEEPRPDQPVSPIGRASSGQSRKSSPSNVRGARWSNPSLGAPPRAGCRPPVRRQDYGADVRRTGRFVSPTALDASRDRIAPLVDELAARVGLPGTNLILVQVGVQVGVLAIADRYPRYLEVCLAGLRGAAPGTPTLTTGQLHAVMLDV